MKLAALCLTAWLMCSCVGVDGRTYFVVDSDTLYATYSQGVIDYCIEDAGAELARLGAPATSAVLTAVVQTCLTAAHKLLMERGILVMPELLPQVVPNGDGNL